MYVYFIRRSLEAEDVTKRASGYHSVVFNGTSSYPDKESDMDWRPPAQTNSNRQPVHIIRSGRYVPSLFGDAIYELSVAEEVQTQLQILDNVEFVEVVFEKLVDLEMPALGDFSMLDEISAFDFPDDMEPTPESYIKLMSDVPEFHQRIGRYFSVLGANLYEVESKYNDISEVALNFGSYYPRMSRRIRTTRISRAALERYPIIRSLGHIFREDAFEIIAPHLELDYYVIARMQI